MDTLIRFELSGPNEFFIQRFVLDTSRFARKLGNKLGKY